MPYDAMPRDDVARAPMPIEAEELLPVKMACVAALVGLNTSVDDVIAFCRRADRRNPETFKRVVSEYFTLAR